VISGLFQEKWSIRDLSYELTNTTQEVSAVDIQNMRKMTDDDYKSYISTDLIHVDHHEILRSLVAGYPLAVTQPQVQILIAYLQELAPRVGER
jgi:hypothetical protein